MKKHFIASSMLLALMILGSCSKEETQKASTLNTEPVKKRAYTYMSLEENYETPENVESEIVDYLGAISNSSNSPMELDAAIWYMEAAVNYTYRRPAYSFEEVVITSTSYEFSLVGSYVQPNDQAYMVNDMIGLIEEGYEDLTFLGADLFVSEINGSEITYGVEFLYAPVSDVPTANPQGRKSCLGLDCNNNSTNSGFKHAGDESMKYHLNSLGLNGNEYIYYNKVIDPKNDIDNYNNGGELKNQ